MRDDRQKTLPAYAIILGVLGGFIVMSPAAAQIAPSLPNIPMPEPQPDLDPLRVQTAPAQPDAASTDIQNPQAQTPPPQAASPRR